MTSSLVPTHSKGFIHEIPASSRNKVSKFFSSYNSFQKILSVSSQVKKGLNIVYTKAHFGQALHQYFFFSFSREEKSEDLNILKLVLQLEKEVKYFFQNLAKKSAIFSS